MAERENGDSSRWGCATFPTVLTIGLALSIFGASIGAGCSVRIPLTEASISTAGSVGSKYSSRRALPNYLEGRVASNNNFINSSTTQTIWVAEGTGVFVVGEQQGSPLVDLHLSLATRNGEFNIEFPRFISYNPRGVR